MQAAMVNAGATLANTDVQVYYYFIGVQFTVVLPEVFNAEKLLFSVDDSQPKTDAGRTGYGAQTFVNTLIGPIPLSLEDHTFYAQYTDLNGVLSKIIGKKVRVEPLAINFQQQPPDFSTITIPGVFRFGVVGAQGYEQYRFDYSIDSDKLDRSQAGPAVSALTVTGLTHGAHALYAQHCCRRQTDACGKIRIYCGLASNELYYAAY
jgi:hypothetical protein